MIATLSTATSGVAYGGAGLLLTTPHRTAQGQYRQTLTPDLGTRPGQADRACAQFDSAMGRVTGISPHYFSHQPDDAFGILRTFPYVLFAALVAIILACVSGMKPHFDEYLHVTETRRAQ